MGTASGVLTIDLTAIRQNYHSLQAIVSPARVAAVVKADAYGLGADRVAPVLEQAGCRDFFTAHFDEAVALRRDLQDGTRIFVLNGLQPGVEAACAKAGIIPVVNSLDQYQRWQATARATGSRLDAVLQFDTGMSRLGVPPQERPALAEAIRQSDAVKVLHIMSHLASADDADSLQNAAQHAEMRKIATEFPDAPVCFANSGGIFLGRDYHGALARAGLALYGGAPTLGRRNPMQAAVRLEVAAIQTRSVAAGTRVGYGGAHVASGEMQLTTIAAGYADGLPRSLGDRGAVYFDGLRLPIVGRVSMDSMTIDTTALPKDALQPGDRVEVLGPQQTLEQLAEDAGTIAYEILTSLGRRYHRQYR
jgi:alanine racemase